MNTLMDCEFPGAIENKFKFPEVMLIRFELLYEPGNPLELGNGISRFWCELPLSVFQEETLSAMENVAVLGEVV